MKKLTILLSLSLGGSSVMAMNGSELPVAQQDAKREAMAREIADSLLPMRAGSLAWHKWRIAQCEQRMDQNEQRNMAAYFPQEVARQDEATQVLGRALGNLPNNKEHTDAAQQAFQQRLRNELPKELGQEIAKFAAKKINTAPAVEKYTKKLIPSIIPRHPDYPSMREMVDTITEKLYDSYKEMHLNIHDPRVVGVAGFWSYQDEGTDFRQEFLGGDFNDVTEFLLSKHPGAHLVPLQHNEFMAILYSDGSIKWRISESNKALLCSIHPHQLQMCVDLFNQPRYLKSPEWYDSYRSLPAPMREAVRSNYAVNRNKTHYLAKHIAENALLYGGAAAWLGFAGWAGYKIAERAQLPPSFKDFWSRPLFPEDKNERKLMGLCAVPMVASYGMLATSIIKNRSYRDGRGTSRYDGNNHKSGRFWTEALGRTSVVVMTGMLGSLVAKYMKSGKTKPQHSL